VLEPETAAANALIAAHTNLTKGAKIWIDKHVLDRGFCSRNTRGCCHVLATCCMKYESVTNISRPKKKGMEQNVDFTQVTAERRIYKLSAVHLYSDIDQHSCPLS